LSKTRNIGAFLSIAIMAGIWRKVVSVFSETKGWRRWLLIIIAGAATGILIAIVLRAF